MPSVSPEPAPAAGHRVRQIVFVPPPPFVAAQACGALQAASLAVTTTLTRSSIEQREALLSGAQDLAVTAMDNVMAWNARGGDFRVLAQVERSTVLTLFAAPGRDSLAALEGARILVDAVDSGFVIVLRDLLQRKAGLTEADYNLVPAGGVVERLERLVAGDGDATLLGPPLDARAEAAGLRPLARVQQAYPAFPGQGVVVQRSRLEALGPALRAYLQALAEGLRWMGQAPEAAQAALLQAGFPGPAAQAVLAARAPGLRPAADGVSLLIALRRRLGVLPAGVRGYDDLVDVRWLPADEPR